MCIIRTHCTRCASSSKHLSLPLPADPHFQRASDFFYTVFHSIKCRSYYFFEPFFKLGLRLNHVNVRRGFFGGALFSKLKKDRASEGLSHKDGVQMEAHPLRQRWWFVTSAPLLPFLSWVFVTDIFPCQAEILRFWTAICQKKNSHVVCN